MINNNLNTDFKNKRVHMVGIKGVGMTALSEILFARGAIITGSDTDEVFYTDAILKSMGIPYYEKFSKEHITADIELVIYSSAYSEVTNCELMQAKKLNMCLLSYSQVLGQLSACSDSCGVAGVHGKTTTTAMAGTILKSLKLPVTVLVGSQVPSLNERSTYIGGDRYFVAETCEYRKNFLKFKPARIVITSIEEDHLDFFKDLKDIINAFVEYAHLLPENGEVIYDCDDAGAERAVAIIKRKRPDVKYIPYGKNAEGMFKIKDINFGRGTTQFTLQGFKGDFTICIPGSHSVFNATAAIALAAQLLKKEKKRITESDINSIKKGLLNFKGSKRRSEIIGTASGILFMDDYAHHPTAIRTTLEGIEQYYSQKRIIVDFMSHTYSRTAALLPEFGSCFSSADQVILHKIYASARERYTGSISGSDLYREVKKHHRDVRYFEEVMDAKDYLKRHLKANDLFITMGAGNNWQLGKALYEEFK
jgi:UDP-N-acetylmuramate--alanine ligase